jgi:hypothetical protein
MRLCGVVGILIGLAAACSGTVSPSAIPDGGLGDGARDAPSGDGPATAGLAIAPLDAVVTAVAGQAPPTLQYTATLDGQPVAAAWSIDHAELGTMDAATGLFTASGTQGGVALVRAVVGAAQSAVTTVTVKLQRTDVGDPAWPAPAPGAGGYGGVGGDGPGAPPTDPQRATLDGTPTADATVKLLYPYDGTVFARGILPPLVQWSPSAHAFDAARLRLREASYEYVGYFARPSTTKPFVSLPIPHDAWEELTYSNGGDTVSVELLLAEGDRVYGPFALTFKVARATLKGTVYYNSYGTGLVKNSGEGSYPNGTGPAFGGATLAIKPGATDPVLVAGTPSADMSGCRVCHAVSANGSLLITQHGSPYTAASFYALGNGNAESAAPSNVAYPALYPDGTLLFSGAGGMHWGDTASRLYSVPSGTVLPAAGIPAGLQATLPAFSPDGAHVAFNFYAGVAGADGKSLAVMDFDRTSTTFSNLRVLHTPTTGPAVWASFLPTNDAVVFEVETVSNEFGFTRNGVRGELWWVDLGTQTATRLDQLNGRGYAPTGPDNHDDDATLNYEPTVSPIAAGGYAWVVFTTRRLYGNVATLDPWASDPRTTDLTSTPTTKKLWVAAIDLNAPPGTDPSHPAFYVPAQELLAGNSRGFWTFDACRADDVDCQSGDECCGGYCRPADGGLACTSTPPSCALEYERCTTDADCCGYGQGIACINGFCAATSPID